MRMLMSDARPSREADSTAVLLTEFRTWLDRERGLSPVSVRCYSKQATHFLTAIGGPGAVHGLDAAQVTAFMVEHSRDRNTWSAKAMVTTRSKIRTTWGPSDREGQDSTCGCWLGSLPSIAAFFGSRPLDRVSPWNGSWNGRRENSWSQSAT